ncbi:MAG TPA: hypothetical protein VIK35_12570 [Verrucomicrobiae bacterium]
MKRGLIAAGIAVTVVSLTQAQTLTGSGQSIIFSTPDDGDAVSNAPSLAALPPGEAGFDSMVQAPNIRFQTPLTTSAQVPMPQQVTISAAEADQRDWWMKTPAQILEVKTPAQELKIKKYDAAGQPENPTAVESFYERQDQMQTNGAAGFIIATPSSGGDFRENKSAWLNANSIDMPRGRFGNQLPQSQAAASFHQPAPGNGAGAGQNLDADWLKNFSAAATKPAQSPVQAENMADFRKLLEPSRPSKSSGDSSGDGLYSAMQKSAFDHQPANPSSPPGHLNSGFGVLPGVAGQNPAPKVKANPDWKPQPPPWMLKGPQPGVVPQRVVF